MARCVRADESLPQIDVDIATAICKEYKIHNADINIRKPNCTTDDLIDTIMGNRCVWVCAVAVRARTHAAWCPACTCLACTL